VKVDQFVVNINSEQPETLIAFYRDIVGLRPNEEIGTGAFMAGSSSLEEGSERERGSGRKEQGSFYSFPFSGCGWSLHEQGGAAGEGGQPD